MERSTKKDITCILQGKTCKSDWTRQTKCETICEQFACQNRSDGWRLSRNRPDLNFQHCFCQNFASLCTGWRYLWRGYRLLRIWGTQKGKRSLQPAWNFPATSFSHVCTPHILFPYSSQYIHHTLWKAVTCQCSVSERQTRINYWKKKTSHRERSIFEGGWRFLNNLVDRTSIHEW